MMLHFLNRKNGTDSLMTVFLRYLCGGAGAAVINFSLYSLLCWYEVHYLLANLLATVFTWIFSFFINKFFVFQQKGGDVKKEGAAFLTLQVFLFLLSFVLLHVFVHCLNWNKYLAWFAVAGGNVIINFTVMRIIIWRTR